MRKRPGRPYQKQFTIPQLQADYEALRMAGHDKASALKLMMEGLEKSKLDVPPAA